MVQWLSSRDQYLGDLSGLFLMAMTIATPGIMSAFKEESLFTLFYLKNRSVAPRGSSLDRSCWPELQGGWESAHLASAGAGSNVLRGQTACCHPCCWEVAATRPLLILQALQPNARVSGVIPQLGCCFVRDKRSLWGSPRQLSEWERGEGESRER